MGNIKSFKDLNIWKFGIDLVKIVYSITGKFPNTENYGLTSQMRRSAVSVPSNIAEGFRRRHKKEFKQFLNIALGSLAELETQTIIAKEINYINQENINDLSKIIDQLSRMITTLYNKI